MATNKPDGENLSGPNGPAGPDEQIKIEEGDSKLLRMFFVGLYLAAVTGLGMTLSVYYLFLWESKMPELPKITRRH